MDYIFNLFYYFILIKYIMFTIFHIAITVLIIVILFSIFFIKENFTDNNQDTDNKTDNNQDTDNKTDNNQDTFLKTKPIDPRDALWDKQIDYCLNRHGTLEDVDFNETLLNYKPKVIIY